MKRIFQRCVFVIFISMLCRTSLADSEPVEITFETFVLKVSSKIRSGLDAKLKAAAATDGGSGLAAMLESEKITVSAASALTGSNGNRCVVKSPCSLEMEPIIGLDYAITITCVVEFEGRWVELENVKFRDGETKLYVFPDSEHAGLETVAVLRVLRSSGGSQ